MTGKKQVRSFQKTIQMSEVIVRLMLSMSDQSGASDSDLDRYEHQPHNDSDGEDSLNEERGKDSDEDGDVKEERCV